MGEADFAGRIPQKLIVIPSRLFIIILVIVWGAYSFDVGREAGLSMGQDIF